MSLDSNPYHAYLRSPEWKERRIAALRYWGYACALNARHRGQLEVHHRCYDRLGAETPTDVIVLCARCHRLFHDLLPAVSALPFIGTIPTNEQLN